MSDKKSPPSKFEEKKEEQEEQKKNVYTKGFIILTDDNFSKMRIVADFEHEGNKYSTSMDLYPMLITLEKNRIERRQFVMELMSAPVEIKTPKGDLKMQFPTLIAQLVVDRLHQIQQEHQIMANMRKGGIQVVK